MMYKRISFVTVTAFLLIACKSKTSEVQPQIKELTEAVYASGTLVPQNEYKVVSSTEGFLQKSSVKEGDSVKRGQLLFALSSNIQRTQEAAASGIVTKTLPITATNAPAIKELENKLEAAKIKLQNDELQYNRYKRLYDQQAISASNYEKFKLQHETSEHDVQALEAELQQYQLNASLQMEQANNQLRIAKTSVNNGILKSYVDGVVYDVYKQDGDLVSPNQPIALIGSGDMIAKLLVDEDDLGKIKMGQEVLITMDAYPDKVFHARVNKIYPLLNRVEQSFRVDALFVDEMPVKLYGLNIEANIVLDKKKAMVIPKQALLKGDSVMVKEKRTVSKVKIRKGAEDNNYVQVLSGISNSSTLIIEQ